ncbi:MAG: PAS domain S-box protein [Solirubrobacteraceae bacterium]
MLDVWDGSHVRGALARLPDCVVVFDRAGVIVDVPSAGALRTERDLLGANVSADLWGVLPWSASGQTGPRSLEWSDPRTATVFAVELVPLVGPDDELLGGIATARDVTAPRRSTELARAVFDGALDAIAVADDDQRYVEVNDAACQLFGYSRSELLEMKISDVLTPDTPRAWDPFLEAGSSAGLCGLRRGDGSVVTAEFRAKASVVEGLHLSILRDVTERLSQEQRLRDAQALFEGAFDAAPVAMAMVDARSSRRRLLRANTALAGLLDTTPERLEGVDALELMHPDDREHAQAARPAGADQTIRISPRLMRPDGTPVYTEIATALVRGPGGHVEYMLAVVVDTAARRFAEEGRRASEERFRTMVQSSSEGVCALDVDESLVFVNPRMAEMLADTAENLMGVHASRIVTEEHRRPLQSALDACRAGRRDRREMCVRRGEGGELPVLVSTSPLTLPDGAYGGVLMMVTDISELVAAAQERDLQRSRLYDSQRLEGIGRLAGGIAHDFNNLLGVVLNFAGFLDAELADRPALRQDVGVIRRAAERGADLTRQLLMFSRRETTTPTLLDLRNVIGSAPELLRSVLLADVVLTVVIPVEPCMVVADRNQIEHVLRSVAINACEAMPQGGELRLELAGGTDDADGRRWITLHVRDSGPGMPAAVAERAFEPFFTTKSEPGGGLGLASVYGIVTDHRGQIEIVGAENEGATIAIRLPEADGPQRHADEPGSATTPGVVLLVEDDVVVRNLATRQLQLAGHSVIACADPREALARGELADGTVGVLLTDLLLPTMTGEQLAREVRERVPGIPVVFMSGYADDDRGRDMAREAGTVFIAKPFTGAELMEGVQRALSGAERV